MLNDYKYAIRTAKQAGNYNKITNYLILHIRKTYEHGGDIANATDKQEPFNFKPDSRSHQLLRQQNHPLEKLEIKHENDQSMDNRPTA